MTWTLAQVALGGALGALARFGTLGAFLRLLGPGFPYGTMVANVAGSFAMGFLVTWLAEKGLMRVAPLALIGFLGSYTTFSTYALDLVRLHADGALVQTALYAAGSVVMAVAALVAGMALARGVVA